MVKLAAMPPPRVDVQEALNALPRSYVLVLRGALTGFSDDQLALLAEVPRESIRPMVRLAAAKLVSALAEPGQPTS